MEYLIVVATVLQSDISAEAKLVWGAIWFLARPTGVCRARYREIGALAGLDKRAVMRAIPELKEAHFIADVGGGNGTARSFTVPPELVQNLHHHKSGSGAQSGLVQDNNWCGNGNGPLPKSNRTTTETVPPYKEEINNNKKSASADAEPSNEQIYPEWVSPWGEPNND